MVTIRRIDLVVTGFNIATTKLVGAFTTAAVNINELVNVVFRTQWWLVNGEDFGEIEQKMARGTLTWTPGDMTDFTIRYEYNENDGQGPAAQTHTNGSGVPGAFANFDRDSFKFSIDEEGFQENETNFLTALIPLHELPPTGETTSPGMCILTFQQPPDPLDSYYGYV